MSPLLGVNDKSKYILSCFEAVLDHCNRKNPRIIAVIFPVTSSKLRLGPELRPSVQGRTEKWPWSFGLSLA